MASLSTAISALFALVPPTTSTECGIPNTTFDYVVVGLGTAGSIAASRLASMGHHVIGIEAGPPLQAANGGSLTVGTFADGSTFTIYDVPALNPFPPAPKEHYWDVGGGHTKGIGGDGARNGALYLRGLPQDFADLVQEHELAEWAWDDVLPYLRMTENDKGVGRGAAYRGSDGPIAITDAVVKDWDLQLLESCKAAGMNQSDDFNKPGGRYGCGVGQMNLDNGVRSSSASAFLPKAKAHGLTVLSDALVTNIVFEPAHHHHHHHHHPRAIGVKVQKRCNGVDHTHVVRVSREVIISGGTLNTPRLLMLSGIGPKEQLTKLGLPVVADLCVGCTLRNHYSLYLEFETNKPWTFPDPTRSYAEYLQSRTGYFNQTHGGTEGAVLVWLESPYSHHGKPDIQLRLFPHNDGNVNHVRFNIDLDSPTSPAGSYNLTSASYDGTPPIFAIPSVGDEDARKFVWAIDQLRGLASTPPLAHLLEKEVLPGPAPTSEAELLEWVRSNAVQCTGHWVGTVPMGEVLLEDLRVKGVDALRVADNSVWPFVLNGNTQAHAWLAGERVADFATAGYQIAI